MSKVDTSTACLYSEAMTINEVTNDYGLTWDEAWAGYKRNHPEVLASWGEQNGRWPHCICKLCDPDELRPRADIIADPDEG